MEDNNDGTNKKGFIGKELDETKLNYVEARYLSANTGKFGQIDPYLMDERMYSTISDPQGLNSYSYSRNNPIVLVDINGQKEKLFDEYIKFFSKAKDTINNGYQSYMAYVSKQNEERAGQYAANFDSLSEREKKLFNNAEAYGRAMVKMDEVVSMTMGTVGAGRGNVPGKISVNADKKLIQETFDKLGSNEQKVAKNSYSQFTKIVQETGKLIHEIANVRSIKDAGKTVFYEIKSRMGVRVYIDKAGEIIGFSNKSNQQKIINKLINMIK